MNLAFKSRLTYVLLMAVSGFGISATGATKANMPVTTRPTVGLVLEGGGALGLAHVGVIQWLEEHRIPVNYIAGTSMGGLVGGVYATGRNASEVLAVVRSVDWIRVMNGQTPFDKLSFRRKQDAREYPSTLEFGLHKGLQFPSGFNSGQDVSLVLDRIALPYSQINSFDDLPIPFACVATDLVTAKQHVFRSGPLNLALRSTMALPGIFTPVQSDKHIYVDGGLLNNMPVDVAKDMGADITLGVHLEQAEISPDATLSSFSVLSAAISSVITVNEHRAMEKADLLVSVPVQKYSMLDFKSADAIIKAGYAAAAANADKLLPLSLDEAEWRRYLAERDSRRRDVVVPQFVAVTGVPSDAARNIEKGFSGVAGHSIDSAHLDDDLVALTGTGPYSTVNYSLIERNGKQGLQLEAESKPYSPPIVRPLIVIDGTSYNNVFFSMGARITFFNFGGYRRELRTDLIVGSQYRFASEYYRPFSPASNWFVAPRGGFNSTQYPLFHNDNLVALYRNREATGGLDLGYGFDRTGELRFGYEGGYQTLKPQVGNSSEVAAVSGITGNFRLQYLLDTRDDPVIPRSGHSLRFNTRYFHQNPGAPHGFPVSELQLQNFFRLSERSTVFLNGYGGSSYGFNTGIPQFELGGATRFLAFGTNELLTNQYFMFQTGYLRKLTNLPPLLGSTIDFVGMCEAGKAYESAYKLPGDVAGALIINTIFGPVEVGGAVGDYGHAKFFFQIGSVF